MVEIGIKYFGMLTDSTGKSNEKIKLDRSITIDELNEFLKEKYSQLNNCKYQIALNNTFTTDASQLITANAEISLLPPFSGG